MEKVLGELSGGILDNEKIDRTDLRLSVLESHYIALEERIVQLESRSR